jgi:hypothetical protein
LKDHSGEAETGYRVSGDTLRALDLPLQLGLSLLEREMFVPNVDGARSAEAVKIFEQVGAGALLADLREPTSRP